jgi:hypothetical protein
MMSVIDLPERTSLIQPPLIAPHLGEPEAAVFEDGLPRKRITGLSNVADVDVEPGKRLQQRIPGPCPLRLSIGNGDGQGRSMLSHPWRAPGADPNLSRAWTH